jgi:CRP/FNR family cyclic AMP-dependent transcriptional regulator
MPTLNDATTLITSVRPVPELVFVNGSEQRVISLNHVPFTIGRKPDKDLVIVDARVSRDHAVIQTEGGDYVLVDTGSKQGSYVNGERVERRKLSGNDRVEFGGKGGPYVVFSPTSVEQLQISKELSATSRISIFSKLAAGDIQELGKIVDVKKYAPDTAVFFQGEPSDSLYMVLNGSVKVTETSPEGHEKILDILGVGEIFGELAMLDGQPRSATVTTCEPTELGSISHQNFRQFAETRPEILWKVLSALCERIRKTSANIVEMSSRDVPYRLLAALSQLAEKHGQIAADGSCMVNLKFGADDLAAMVGSSREVVSRLLHRYEEEGLVELGKNKQLIIPDPAALTRALDYASEWS